MHVKAYADNFTEAKIDFFEMRNASYKKTSSDNGFDDVLAIVGNKHAVLLKVHFAQAVAPTGELRSKLA